MIISKIPIYLASKSPRRREMLDMMKIKYQTIDIDLEEQIIETDSPIKNVKRLALEKCDAALSKIEKGIVISADTIVVLDGLIIGKPKSKIGAERILHSLSGKSHNVYTGFSIANKKSGKIITDYSKTRVDFRILSKKEIKDYIKTGSPMDKAGAYGIQDDYGAVFVNKIIGSYYNVLGFPASKIYEGIKSIL